MTFRDLKFLADENISQQIIDSLKSEGIDIQSVFEYGLNGKPDLEILAVAFGENRTVLTQDADFGQLIFAEKRDFVGIIYLRPGHIKPEVNLKTLSAILAESLQFKAPFILVAENNGTKIRIRLRNSIF